MDITDRILNFRDTVMHIWNDVYVTIINDRGGDFNLEENFCEVEIRLFESMVSYYLPNDFDVEDIIGSHMKSPGLALKNFTVVPSGNSMRANVNREFHSGYWDHPQTNFSAGEAVINFVHFFDWSSLDCPRKYEFYLGRIKSCKNDSELNGKDVLIPIVDSKIYYKNAEQTDEE